MHVARLRSEISEIGAQAIFVPVERILNFNFEVFRNQLILAGDFGEIDAKNVSSVFVRRMPGFENFGFSSRAKNLPVEEFIGVQKEAAFQDWLYTLSLSTPFYNDHQAAARCMGKVYQRMQAQKIGFQCPDEFVGEGPARAKKFVSHVRSGGGKVCTKPIANMNLATNRGVYTRYTEILPADRDGELDDLNGCPLIFQSYQEKQYELRVSVVDDFVFACKISSQEAGGVTAVDWRQYNIARTPHSEYELPPNIQAGLKSFHKATGLRFSSFDLIRRKDGEYVFLETNPYGQWLWIEDFTGLNITRGIANCLVEPMKMK